VTVRGTRLLFLFRFTEAIYARFVIALYAEMFLTLGLFQKRYKNLRHNRAIPSIAKKKEEQPNE